MLRRSEPKIFRRTASLSAICLGILPGISSWRLNSGRRLLV